MSARANNGQKPRRGRSREEVDDILGAALDDLDDDAHDDLDDDAQPQPAQPRADRVMFGPEPPPPHAPGPVGTSSGEGNVAAMSSLEDTMSQLLKAGEALETAGSGGELDLDSAERMLDELMARMQVGGDLGEESAAASSKTLQQEGSASGREAKETASKEGGAQSVGQTDVSKGKDDSRSPKPSVPPTSSDGESDVDRAVSRLLSDMAKAGADDETGGMEASQMEAIGEEMMESMMKEMAAFGSSGDADDVVDGMMRQLLSKDLMYDPMKQVCDRFPAWLAKGKESLTEEEYERYGKQYQYFQRIVHVYENDPENFPRLMELMQDIQEYGQPPADIIKELAPGLEFDSEGMPKMDGQGMPPGIPPFAPGGEQCSIM